MSVERIVLGSGKIYIAEFTGTIPVDATIETDANLFGLIQGGASLSYEPSYYEAKDDLGLKTKRFLTDEIAILKSGLMTFNGNTINKLLSTGRITETAVLRTLKIGGAANFVDKSYVLQFVHADAIDGDVRVTIVGKNQSALEITFAKDKETVINAEFKAIPHDTDGTLIIYKEEIPAA